MAASASSAVTPTVVPSHLVACGSTGFRRPGCGPVPLPVTTTRRSRPGVLRSLLYCAGRASRGDQVADVLGLLRRRVSDVSDLPAYLTGPSTQGPRCWFMVRLRDRYCSRDCQKVQPRNSQSGRPDSGPTRLTGGISGLGGKRTRLPARRTRRVTSTSRTLTSTATRPSMLRGARPSLTRLSTPRRSRRTLSSR